jgi:hypothetical protein
MPYIDVPACTEGEGLIAFVILANIELLCGTVDESKVLITRALDIAERIGKNGISYRLTQLSKFACFTCDFGEDQETLPLPIINDMLILPAINLQEVVNKMRQSITMVVDLKDVSVAYYRLQLNTGNIINALKNAKNASTASEAMTAISNILHESLTRENKPSDPLDIAGDNFILARNLMAKGNVTLTRIALHNANKALEAYDIAGEVSAKQRKRLQAFRSELRTISEAVQYF